METGRDSWVSVWQGTGQELWGHKGGNTCLCLVSREVASVVGSLGVEGGVVLKPYQEG